jgi:hypothetical protein
MNLNFILIAVKLQLQSLFHQISIALSTTKHFLADFQHLGFKPTKHVRKPTKNTTYNLQNCSIKWASNWHKIFLAMSLTSYSVFVSVQVVVSCWLQFGNPSSYIKKLRKHSSLGTILIVYHPNWVIPFKIFLLNASKFFPWLLRKQFPLT